MQSHSFDEFVKFYFVKGSLCLKIEEFGSQLSRASSENEEK